MLTLCDGCGTPLHGGYSHGTALVCRDCEPELIVRMQALRDAGKPVNARHIARAMLRETACGPESYMLKDIPTDLLTWAKAQPEELRTLILVGLYQLKAEREAEDAII